MRLHANTPEQTPSSATQRQLTCIQDAITPETPEIPAGPSMTIGPDQSIDESHLFEPLDMASSEGILDSQSLLDWLMPEFHNNVAVPLPMADFPGHFHPMGSLMGPLESSNSNALAVDNATGPGKHAIHQIYKLIDDLSKRLNSDMHNTGLTPVFLDACLKEYFGKVSPRFPILHEPTFSARECIPPLLLNIVALGSLFVCQPGAASKGEMLWRLGHTAVATSWQTLISLRGPRDRCNGIQLVLTALLGQTYALLSSNSNIRTTAFVFHGLGFYWARTCGVDMVEDFPLDSLPSLDDDAQSKDEVWKLWAASEVQRRASLGHYILDGLIAQASGSPASARHAINSIGVACSDAAFAAKTADEWIEAMVASKNASSHLPFSKIFVQTCSEKYSIASLQLSQFSVSVILEGLQSFVSDLDEANSLALGTVSRSQITRDMLSIHEGNLNAMQSKSSSSDEYLPLILRWHAIFIELSTPTISLYRHISETYNLPQALGGVPIKGSSGPFDHTKWAKSAKAFRSLLHALSIAKILQDIPLGQAHSIHIPSAIFAAAVVLSTLALENKEPLNIPKEYRWHDLWADILIDDPQGISAGLDDNGAIRLLHSLDPSGTHQTNLVDLFYELNCLQICLKNVSSWWGIATQMEESIGRLVMLANGG